jgi:hypothetical protein
MVQSPAFECRTCGVPDVSFKMHHVPSFFLAFFSPCLNTSHLYLLDCYSRHIVVRIWIPRDVGLLNRVVGSLIGFVRPDFLARYGPLVNTNRSKQRISCSSFRWKTHRINDLARRIPRRWTCMLTLSKIVTVTSLRRTIAPLLESWTCDVYLGL